MPEIIGNVFSEYPIAHYKTATTQPRVKRSIRCQYREIDYAFVIRLLAEEGLSFRIEHEQSDDKQQQGSIQPRHTVIVSDNDAQCPVYPQPQIRFHRADATESENVIERFSHTHSVGTNAVTLASRDYRALAAISA